MKRSITITMAAIVLGALILGPMTLFSHLRAARESLRSELQSMSSDAHEAARIRVLLRDMVQGLFDYQAKLDDVSAQAEAAVQAADRAQRELEKQAGILARAKTMLDEDHNQFEIGGKRYSRKQLCDDAAARLQNCEELQETLTFQRDLAAKLRAAERDGLANLRKALQLKQKREAELKKLETRLANAGLLIQVNELAGELEANPFGPQTELGEAFAEFRQRVRTVERQADYIAAESRNGVIVDWNPNVRTDAETSQAIGQFLADGIAP